jgi:hypothetical protein
MTIELRDYYHRNLSKKLSVSVIMLFQGRIMELKFLKTLLLCNIRVLTPETEGLLLR